MQWRVPSPSRPPGGPRRPGEPQEKELIRKVVRVPTVSAAKSGKKDVSTHQVRKEHPMGCVLHTTTTTIIIIIIIIIYWWLATRLKAFKTSFVDWE